MSYCRWSSLYGYSDVYVYEGDAGWVTHVKDERQPAGVPIGHAELLVKALYPEEEGAAQDAFNELLNEMRVIERDWRMEVSRTPIDHPDAGRKFVHDSPGECADNLARLAREGFIVSADAFWNLRKEQEELDHDK